MCDCFLLSYPFLHMKMIGMLSNTLIGTVISILFFCFTFSACICTSDEVSAFQYVHHLICYPTASVIHLGDGSAGKCVCVCLMKLWHVTSVICHVCWNNQNLAVGEGKHEPSYIIVDIKLQPEALLYSQRATKHQSKNDERNLNGENKISFIVLVLTLSFLSKPMTYCQSYTPCV